MTVTRAPRAGLAVRLALAFAGVAVLTALAVAIAAPPIVGRGFEAMRAGQVSPSAGAGVGPGQGRGTGMGAGMGQGGGMGAYAAQVQQETTATIIGVAVVAAALASLLGAVIARRLATPLVRLEAAAAAVAEGDLAARSGLADRRDELGSLGRSFDAMAADLERSEAARRRFFQDAAHEMKTPLAVIEATAAAVMDGVYPHDDRHLETIREQARILGRVVDDLRTISLADAGALPLVRAPVPLADVVRAVVDAFRARAEAHGATITAEPGADPVVVDADRDRLTQALAAFADNAARYAAPVGGIVVRVVPPAAGGMGRVEVADDGPGIADADLPRLFDRFYQADASRSRATGTSGLGLAIARAIADAHGGRVGVANRPEGGAVFWLEVPLAGPR
jgi:two-component system sensor histidine kinase BaeS